MFKKKLKNLIFTISGDKKRGVFNSKNEHDLEDLLANNAEKILELLEATNKIKILNDEGFISLYGQSRDAIEKLCSVYDTLEG